MVKWNSLLIRQVLGVNQLFESCIVERSTSGLLLEAHVAKNTLDDVNVQWYRSCAYSHEIKHSFGVEVLFLQSQLFDGNIW